MTREELHEYGLFEAIQDLHMNLNGSSDTLIVASRYRVEEVAAALRIRYSEWQFSKKFSHYDICVKDLLGAVLLEYERNNV